MKTFFTSLLLLILFTSCSKNINYSPEHIKQTSGRYLFNQDEVIEVFYENNDLFITWKRGKIKPVVLDENTFFVPDMYQKLRFVVEPDSKKRYLGVVDEDDENKVVYAYPKVADNYKTAVMYLRDKEYEKALAAFKEQRQNDTTQVSINEYDVNRMGYELLRDKKFDDAITVFEINTVLYPDSANVYDSLGESYLKKGDSLNAYNNFKKAFELNSGNKRAKEFMESYIQQQN